MCCFFGDGSYVLILLIGEVLVFGGSFEEQEVNNFCVSGSDGGSGCLFFNDLYVFEVGYFYLYLDWILIVVDVEVYWICFKRVG